MRIRKKLVFLHTCFSLALAIILVLAIRPAVSRIVRETEADEATALKALHRKYGIKMKLTDFFSGLAGKKNKRTYIKVVPR